MADSVYPLGGQDVNALAEKKDSEATIVEPLDLQGDHFDHGIRAWGTVIGSWLVQFCIIGVPLSFGATESFYAREYLAHYTPSQINWIGSLQLCLMYLLGLAVAGLFDAGHFHFISIAGSILFLFSFFMLSLAKEGQYYQVFLSQGLGMGIGTGIMYTPTSSVVAHHFRKRRNIAMGIITTGSAFGGFFFSSIFGHFLGGSIGFAWGIRIGAFVCLGCLCTANLLMRTNYPQKQTPRALSATATPLTTLLRTPAYMFIILYGLTISLSLYNPMFSVELFAQEHDNIPSTLTSYLVAIINLSSTLGRTIPNWLADRYGVFPVYIPCVAAAGIMALVMTVCTTAASITVFCVLYGFFSGACVSLFFPAVLSLDPDLTRSGLRLGLASVPVGIASLAGTPIAAAVVGGNHRWWAGSVFTGVLELASAGLLLAVYVTKQRFSVPT
ncbi:MFS general substrate transporter [Guyanagaster necrorhizus]|uniref:MFS general substrate transporter n=1 Tax=Guyanagaster necrorhizus TaxID=856835 RepID=A0A9P8AQ95_9AGAR|nr:MFS general substrate transporter [Guyanagaster necrorhizus MCA 3950]KAG7444138.1 MFS general substrate transporter [Guyanagaster necrorhizus MCA 3950]